MTTPILGASGYKALNDEDALFAAKVARARAVPTARGAAIAAVLIVGAVGVILRHPLSRVPENMVKFAVGLLLTTFGTFWVGEGIGLPWLGDDLALVWLLAANGLAALVFVCLRLLEQQREASQAHVIPTKEGSRLRGYTSFGNVEIPR